MRPAPDGLRVEARRLVQRHWRWAEAVAAVLQERERFGPDEVDALQARVIGGGR